MLDLRKKQKEAREAFVENAVRQMQRTSLAQDGSQSHETNRQMETSRMNLDSNRSTPDLIKESSSHYHSISSQSALVGKQTVKESGPTQGEPGEKKPAANSKDSKLLNELSMKQIDSMSRTRVKSSMMSTKTDAKVSRPSLNELKLTQQQQKVSVSAKASNAMQSSSKQPSAMQSNTKQSNTMQPNTKQSNTMQSNTKQSSTMQSNTMQQVAKVGNALLPSSHTSNTLSEKQQINEPTKSDYWIIPRPGDSTAICTSIDSVVGYNPSTHLPSTTKVPYTTHPNQGGLVMQPPVTQYPVTHLPVTCGTQSSMSVLAANECAPSTSLATGQNAHVGDRWYPGNASK